MQLIQKIKAYSCLIITMSMIGCQPSYTQSARAKPNIVRGVCWVAGDSIVSQNLDPLITNNVNWISQTPFGWQKEHDDPNLRYSGYNDGYWGESDAGLIGTAELAHQKGINVMMKPHIWMHSKSGKWRSDIEMQSDADWDLWFANYTKFILHYAAVAEAGKMESLCIGTELYLTTTKQPERWRKVIRQIREVYHGKLTYAANFYKEYEEITFWDELDAIGIQGYFPLAKKLNPTKAELCNAWQPHIQRMEQISRIYGKPIIFTEIGYRNTADAAEEPWVWPRQTKEGTLISEETQANCMNAMFESLWTKDWFDGVFIWKWFHTTYKNTGQTYGEYEIERLAKRKKEGRDSKRGMIRFTPQGRQAEVVMRDWFGRVTTNSK